MNQNEKFNNILNECLDRILEGETVEQCLGKYPEQAQELEPLLRTAQAAKIASTIQPRQEFKARARYEFQVALREMAEKKSQHKSFFNRHWQWQSGWAVSLVVIMVVVLGGGSTVAASSNSMPNGALYSVKLASEQVQLAVTPSEVGKAELNAKFANRRTDEIVYMANKGDAQEVQIVAQRLNTNLQNMTNLVAVDEDDAFAPAGGSAEGNTFSANSATDARNGQEPMMGVASAPAPSLSAQAAPPQALAAPATDNAVPASSVPAVSKQPPASPVPEPTTSAPVPAAVSPKIASAPLTPEVRVPTPQVTVNSSDSKAVLENQNTRNSKTNTRVSSADREKLKNIIVENYNARKSRLEEALKKSSAQVRPAIRQAIAQSESEFEKALKHIETAENAR